MLLQIRNYISREKVVSTQQLCREFRLDREALQPMLDLWVSKGNISLCVQNQCKSSCGKCRTIDYYRYN